jgi:hypothetical protein
MLRLNSVLTAGAISVAAMHVSAQKTAAFRHPRQTSSLFLWMIWDMETWQNRCKPV